MIKEGFTPNGRFNVTVEDNIATVGFYFGENKQHYYDVKCKANEESILLAKQQLVEYAQNNTFDSKVRKTIKFNENYIYENKPFELLVEFVDGHIKLFDRVSTIEEAKKQFDKFEADGVVLAEVRSWKWDDLEENYSIVWSTDENFKLDESEDITIKHHKSVSTLDDEEVDNTEESDIQAETVDKKLDLENNNKERKNMKESQYDDEKSYKVSFGTGTYALHVETVQARNEQDAADNAADQIVSKGLKGLYNDYDDLQELTDDESVEEYAERNNLINLGNEGFYFDLVDVKEIDDNENLKIDLEEQILRPRFHENKNIVKEDSNTSLKDYAMRVIYDISDDLDNVVSNLKEVEKTFRSLGIHYVDIAPYFTNYISGFADLEDTKNNVNCAELLNRLNEEDENIRGLGEYYNQARFEEVVDNKYVSQLSKLKNLVDGFDYNGPDSREDPVPSAVPNKFNQINIPDRMRTKYFDVSLLNKNTVKFTYITQEDFNANDTEVFRKELIRYIKELTREFNIIIPFKINVDVSCRNGRRYGEYEDIISINNSPKNNECVNKKDRKQFTEGFEDTNSDTIQEIGKSKFGDRQFKYKGYTIAHFPFTMELEGEEPQHIESYVINSPAVLTNSGYHLPLYPEDENGHHVNFRTLEEVKNWIDKFNGKFKLQWKHGDELHAVIKNDSLDESLKEDLDDTEEIIKINSGIKNESIDFVKKYLSSLKVNNTLRSLKNDEKAPKGFRFKSGTGREGEVNYNGIDYAWAIIPKTKELKVMKSSDAGSNWSETIFKESSSDTQYGVLRTGGSVAERDTIVKAYKTKEEAKEEAKKYRKNYSRGGGYYGIKYSVVPLTKYYKQLYNFK